MTRDPVTAASSLSSALRTFSRPWPIMLAGLASTVIGLALTQTPLLPLRLSFLGAGILMAGSAVARRLQTANWDLLEERAESAGLLAFAAFVALLAFFNMEESWDSGRIFLGVFIALALVGSFLVLLPRSGRRIAAVVLVLLHFGGILTAVTSVAPPQSQPPWISMQLWTHFYRYYLFFGYFTNAYHFYSPEPGPATLLWFHVEYEDGSARWIKIPNRHESPVGLHHQRMLAAAESTALASGFLLTNKEEIDAWEQRFKCKYILLPGIPHDTGEAIVKRRGLAAQLIKFVDPNDGRPAPLYLVGQLPGDPNQYSEPTETGRRLISSFARHIAHTSPDPNNPHNAVKAVRVYRVVHRMITPRELSENKDPVDPTTFLPFYMGKYDRDGKLLDGGKYDRDGKRLQPPDPFLFFHVPIIRVPKRYPEPGTYLDGPMLNPHWEPKPGEQAKIIDFVEIHATQSDKFQPETSEK
ncbi:MAG: hypothetical protein ACYC3I_24410 [Gemmataceae bacterium]